MKFIKAFEEYNRLKKYFIANNLGVPMIFEVINQWPKRLTIKILYYYNNNELLDYTTIDRNHSPYNKNRNVFDDNILYESDDLNDCKEKIKFINKAKKYNIL